MDLELAQREENNLNSLIPDSSHTADASPIHGITMKTTASQESRIQGVGARFADFFQGAGYSDSEATRPEESNRPRSDLLLRNDSLFRFPTSIPTGIRTIGSTTTASMILELPLSIPGVAVVACTVFVRLTLSQSPGDDVGVAEHPYAFPSRPALHHYATASVEPPMIRTSIDTATSRCLVNPVDLRWPSIRMPSLVVQLCTIMQQLQSNLQ